MVILGSLAGAPFTRDPTLGENSASQLAVAALAIFVVAGLYVSEIRAEAAMTRARRVSNVALAGSSTTVAIDVDAGPGHFVTCTKGRVP
jgi:hypothetical protein